MVIVTLSIYYKDMNTPKNYISWDEDYAYPLEWLYESISARNEYQDLIYRSNVAMLGRPSKNLYQDEIASNLKRIPENELDQEERTRCLCVPEGRSYVIREAVNNIANQMAGGVESYEYKINDPYMLIDDETEDLLATKCEQDYIESNLEQFSATFSRDLTLYGLTAVLVKYDVDSDRNDIYRIHPKNVWFDTMYSSTGKERFRGYSTMISFAKLKEMIEHDLDLVNPFLTVPSKSYFNKNGEPDNHIRYEDKSIVDLNDLQIYVEDLNKLAASPSLQGRNFMGDWGEYDHDLKSCYNLNWYQTLAQDPVKKTKSGYNGDDVELTVMYDLDRKIEFKIINRRFVISANKDAFRRKIAFPIYNPITDKTEYRLDDFCLECPLKFQYEKMEGRDALPFPMAPVYPLLDLHDILCAWRAKREHVSKLLAILRIETNGADASSLKKTLNVMGAVLDDIQGDINSINFAYDYTPIDSEIQYLETTIIKDLHAYDQFDAMQAMGDRATAAEAGNAVGAIAQGLSTHQNAVMHMYSTIARQCIANRVAYSPKQEFAVTNLGGYSSVTIQQMALNAVINVKSKSSKRVQERMLAANAVTIVSNFKDILTPEGIAYFLEQALLGQAPRKMIKSFINIPTSSEQEQQIAQMQAQNMATMLKQNQAAYEQDPMAYETQNIMDTQNPEEIDQIITALVNEQGGGRGQAIEPEADDLRGSSPEADPYAFMQGTTSDFGAMMGNQEALV